MTDPNQNPPRPSRYPIAESVRDIYDKSSEYIKYGMFLLEALVVLFTIPHNIFAFAGTDEILSITSIFPFIGVMTIEGTLVFGFLHYTHGWLASHTHRKAADQTIYATLTILVLNAITAHVITVIGVDQLGPMSSWLFHGYSAFILPSTPIICIALSARLTARHPAIVALGRKLAHLSRSDDRRRSSEAGRESAQLDVEEKRIDMEKTRLSAEFDALKIGHDADLEEMIALAKREANNRKFIIDREQKMLKLREEMQNNVLSSDEFRNRALLAEQRELMNELNEAFPHFDTDSLVDSGVYQSQQQEIDQLRQELGLSTAELKDATTLIEQLMEEVEKLRQEQLSVPLSSDSSHSDGQPAYANGATAD